MSDSYVSITPHAISFVGRDAVDLFRARTLLTSLRMYARTGMMMTRGLTLTRMLALAGAYTGKRYKRTQITHAIEDLRTWADAFALSLEHRVEGK